MSIERIKPCWCKSDKQRFHKEDHNPVCYAFGTNQWHVKCFMCRSNGPAADSRKKAIEKWNSGPEPTFGLECLLWRMGLEVPELRADSVPSVKALEIINEHIEDLLDQKESELKFEQHKQETSSDVSIEEQAQNLYNSGYLAVWDDEDEYGGFYIYDPATYNIINYACSQEGRDVWNALRHLQETL